MKIVLLDIDGTLLHGGGLWKECFEASLRAEFPGVDFPSISYSGKTDRQLVSEFLAKAGIAPELKRGVTPPHAHEEFSARVLQVIEGYIEMARAKLEERGHEVKLLPGVKELLPRLVELERAGRLRLGLLTGNIRHGARMKLGQVGALAHFSPELPGAFGDDHWDRYALPEIARRHFEQRHGRPVAGSDLVIVGDTEHDVLCGRSIGARAIAVGTGSPSQRAPVLAAKPDHFFEDLSDAAAFERAVFTL